MPSGLKKGPLWLLLELTHLCPLSCAHCSNPLELTRRQGELKTDDWIRVLREARALGAVQLGLSGGEPLLRPDLEDIVREGRRLGYYTNLITSGMGLGERRLGALIDAGIDHVQLSFQAGDVVTNNVIGAAKTFDRKVAAARAVKRAGLPMVMNFVVSRLNIDRVDEMLCLAGDLGADYVELANVQFDGWAYKNRHALLPSREQIEAAFGVVERFRSRQATPKVMFVVPDYFQDRPKPCCNGWGETLLVVAPNGTALPCHGASKLPLAFPNVKASPVSAIWRESSAFNAYRGTSWMREPCQTCPERERDHGGCRCQAFLWTGDAASADPVCDRSPARGLIDALLAESESARPSLIPRGQYGNETPFGTGVARF